jgi:DNA ligase-1
MDALPKLFKYSVTGALQEWCIEVDGDRYRTHSGQVGGKTTTTAWTTCAGKNTGRANATTAAEQAYRDAKSKWQKKQDREQFSTDAESCKTAKFVNPMLAQRYEDRRDELNFDGGVWIQCKLNGARCIATKDGLFSRKGSRWDSVPHIEQALVKFFEQHPDVILDGELFNEDLREDLGSIISMISRKKITPQDLEKSKQYVKYYVYDVVDTSTQLRDRLEVVSKYIQEINSCSVQGIDTHLVASHLEIDGWLRRFEQQGHEGVMIRTNGVYECKRSKHLLKHKSFTDDEFDIVGVIEGEGNLSGKIGAFVLRDAWGVEFNSAPTGSHAYWEQMWKDRDVLVGRKATVKYKELTPIKNGGGGVPSFGKVVAIRDYEG